MELTVTPPTTYFAAVESALSDHGVRPLTVLRWSGGGNGLQGVGYLPDVGSGVTVLTTHLERGSQVGWDPCTLLPGSTSDVLADPPAGTRTTEPTADGPLVTVDNHAAPTAPRDPRTEPLDTAATQAVLVTASSVVSVTTWAMDTPAASAVADRRPVDVETVQALAKGPRLRW